MRDNRFRDGFMSAVVLFGMIIAAGMVVKGIVPSTERAFVVSRVSEQPSSVSELVNVEPVSDAAGSSPTESAPPKESSSVSGNGANADDVNESRANEPSESAEVSGAPISESEQEPPESPPVTEESSDAPASLPEYSSDISESEAEQSSPPESSVSSAPLPVSSAPFKPGQTEPININTATSRELQSLSGIGEVKARAIVDYRNEHGFFASVDELINVKGIGEKTLEKIRAFITV